METIHIYEFLHLLSLIKIRPNMDFGGNLAFAKKKKSLLKRMEKGSH
jgi:hypothetical protein